jgi:fatty-acyl-CoA synthase
MSLELIAYHASTKPSAVAMVDAFGKEHTYEETRRTIIKLARMIEARLPDLRKRQPVGVAYADKQWHFLLTLALEALGIATLPFVQPIDVNLSSALSMCGMLLAGDPPTDAKIPFFRLEQSWLEAGDDRLEPGADAQFAPHRFFPDDVVLILVTSGSEGIAKCIPLHRQARDLREYNRIWRYAMGPSTRYLVSLPLTVATVNFLARATLRCGGTVVFWRDQTPAESFNGITHATFLPAHLVQLMTVIAPNAIEPRNRFKLFSIGAPLSDALREKASTHLNAEIFNLYGCNEIGGCASIDESGVAHVLPGVELEMVDSRMQAVEFGEAGSIRVRSEEMATRYLDEQSTREKFVDGWFMTGDTGVMIAPRCFQLSGRADHMINIGGLKVPPDGLEEALSRSGLARDLAVCSLPNADGIHELHVAVAEPMQDQANMLRIIAEKIGPGLWPVRLVLLQRIPRGHAGKIQRAQLVEQVRRLLKGQG